MIQASSCQRARCGKILGGWTNDFLRKYDFDQAAHLSVSGNHPLPDKQIFVDQDEMGKTWQKDTNGFCLKFLDIS